MAQYDVVVLGGGPGGYEAAIRCAQLGLSTACIDENKQLGGTCLRVGCIPSKVLLECSDKAIEAQKGLAEFGVKVSDVSVDIAAVQKRRAKTVTILTKGIEGLFKKNNVTRLTGRGRLLSPNTLVVTSADGAQETVEAGSIILATGSVSANLPGITPDGDRIITSTEALSLPAAPARLIVIGAGAIGLELGSVWSRFGSKVTVLEYMPRILPGTDGEIAAEAQKLLAKQGLDFHLGCRVQGAEVTGDEVTVSVADSDPFTADVVLVAVGRRPNTADLGLETVGLTTDRRGFLEIDDNFATKVNGIYAIGDIVRGPMLAHKAAEEGVAAAEIIATGVGHVDYNVIPAICYTHPEVAGVGQTEEQLQQAGTPYRKGTFPFIANGRARALGQTDGRVKILAHAETDRVLGVHIIGPRAGDLIAEAAAAMAFGASSEDVARVCHAHPTLSEALKEAALDVDDRAMNI